ncbi:MAG: isopenicillin N synthase family dioxygenase [Parvibaculales bacterium]
MQSKPNMHALPIIDISAFIKGDSARKQSIAGQAHDAVRDYGFFYLSQHGLNTVIEDCFAAAQWFFYQETEEKQKIHIDKSPCHRGWYAFGGETLDPHHNPEGDYKEGLKIGNDLPATHAFVQNNIPLHGPNQWPSAMDQESLNFRQVMETAHQEFSKLANHIVHILALSLELPENYFDAFFKTPMTTLSPIFYPPQKQAETQWNIGAGAHTDFGMLSILAQDGTAGLEINHQNNWLSIPPITDMLVVNIGDMLDFWTQGYYRSTMHRVQNQAETARQSLVFFYDPQYDTKLAPITSPKLPVTHQASHDKQNVQTALDHLLKKIEASFFNDEK